MTDTGEQSRKRPADPEHNAPPSGLSNQNYEETHPDVAGEEAENPEDHRRRTGEHSRRESRERRD